VLGILDCVDEPQAPPGTAAYIGHRRAPFGDGLVPEDITHVAAGLRWAVLEVLDHWRHPDGMKARGSACIEAWKLRVAGPLPGRPSQRGEFVMIAKTYADRPYWWITPITGRRG
jgi:hypothetical protein